MACSPVRMHCNLWLLGEANMSISVLCSISALEDLPLVGLGGAGWGWGLQSYYTGRNMEYVGYWRTLLFTAMLCRACPDNRFLNSTSFLIFGAVWPFWECFKECLPPSAHLLKLPKVFEVMLYLSTPN